MVFAGGHGLRIQSEYPICAGVEGCAADGAADGSGLPGVRSLGSPLHSRNRDSPSNVPSHDPMGSPHHIFLLQAVRGQPVQEPFERNEHAHGGCSSSDVGDGASLVARNDPTRVMCNAVGVGGLGEFHANMVMNLMQGDVFVVSVMPLVIDRVVGDCRSMLLETIRLCVCGIV